MSLSRFAWPVVILLGLCLLSVPDLQAATRKSRPVVQPDLKIVSVSITPDPYVPGAGPLNLRLDIELPDDVATGTLLDVSALIASPSKRSMRYLANRQPVEIPAPAAGRPAAPAVKPHVSIILSWDGVDQRRRPVTSGRFSYEIRAKLLSVGHRGARTQMTSWPKRGTISVLEPVAQPESGR